MAQSFSQNDQANNQANDQANDQAALELYTLHDVYGIEFGVRGYWKCVFENSPIAYRKKAMIAKSCTESDYAATFQPTRVGLINIFRPDVLQMPTLHISFYDDNASTIENWLIDWKNKMKINNSSLAYIDDYAEWAFCYQYSPQFELLLSSKYLVAPIGKINKTNSLAEATTIYMEFQVFLMEHI